MTTGRGMVNVSAWRSRSCRSTISARSLSTSTVARRTVQTFIGSNVALRTSTRPPVGLTDTSLGNFTDASGGVSRIGPEHLHHTDPGVESGQGFLHVRVACRAFQIGEEHVVPEPS